MFFSRVKPKKKLNSVWMYFILAITLYNPLHSFADSSLPVITLFAPSDFVAYNTKRILVFGKIDGSTSEIQKVFINGEKAKLIEEKGTNPKVFDFSGFVQFQSDGINKITISAIDKNNNAITKTISIITDTTDPELDQLIEPQDSKLKITGLANGTGSNIVSITVNDIPQPISDKEEVVNFTLTTDKGPVKIIGIDASGNKREITISNPLSDDIVPPSIEVLNPTNGEIVNGSGNITVSVEVFDDTEVKEVSISNVTVTQSEIGSYSSTITLNPGENLISIKATDTSNNESVKNIQVSYLPEEENEDLETQKVVITIPPETKDLNDEIINQFTQISTKGGELIDINSLGSVEISNLPEIPEGASATIDLPEIEGLEKETPKEGPPEIPKGFSFATSVSFQEEGISNITDEEKKSKNSAILVDSARIAFIVGFGFLKEAEVNNLSRNKKYRFQTTGGSPLELFTILTVPGDATEGNATVSVLGKSQTLATIPLKINPPKDVKIGKRIIGKPQIVEPIDSVIKKSGTKLKLIIKGKNFVGHIATIDGKLQKLLSKAKFFTNVTFVPDEGITIGKFKLLKNKIVITARLKSNVAPGLKLFNVITPKGADIGGIVFPDQLTDGKLETTANPTELILTKTTEGN